MDTVVFTGLYSAVIAALALFAARLLFSCLTPAQAETAPAYELLRPMPNSRPRGPAAPVTDPPIDLYRIVVIDLANDEIHPLPELECRC